MADAPRESQAAPGQRERISESEVRQALRRNTAENRPTNPRDAERQDAENDRDLKLMTMAVEMLPREGRIFQKELEKAKKKSEKPHLIESQKRTQAVIGAYMQGLKQDLRAGFTEEEFRQSSRAHGKGIQRRIEAMLDQAQREGLVTVWNGRVANRVDYAAAWIEELQQMRNGPDLTPKQKQAVLQVERFFQLVLDGDPVWAHTQKIMSQRRPDSLAVQRGKGALKMLGVLALGGMALLSGLLDMKNKRVSPYTLAWLGLTGWSVGFFKGQAKIVRDQLSFVPTKEWENLCQKLVLKGKDGVTFIDDIQKKHKGKNGPKLRKLLKKGREQKRVDPKEYIKLLVGENPQGPDAQMEAKLKTLSPAELYTLCFNLAFVDDRTANALLRDFTEHNVNSQTVAPDLKQLQSPPSASVPSGTPQGHPLQE
ncbi:MAG: hypothetical protein PHX93_00495 [Candidatus Peribacteraceae bacterium]|jgi:hypothetical protein|nr:hypothetical protein [Candidatus Peribacteraceae bacterium]